MDVDKNLIKNFYAATIDTYVVHFDYATNYKMQILLINVDPIQ